MFWRTTREPGVEGEPEVLDFTDSDWILDHHHHNLIQKISKPERSWVEVLTLWITNTARSIKARNNQTHIEQRSQDLENQESSKEKPQEGLVNGPLSESPNDGGIGDDTQSYRINFSELQRLHLRKLQYTLVKHVVDLRYRAQEPLGWAKDLREYVQALQDYDYMGEQIHRHRDPFYVTGEQFIDRCMLQAAMDGKETDRDPLHWAQSNGKWESNAPRPEPVGGTRGENSRRAWIKGFWQRVGIATVGGIFLIVPMWLMALHNTLYTALVSTTAFVVVFGLMMALFLNKSMDVLSSTAAYAAVLVVLVGLTT